MHLVRELVPTEGVSDKVKVCEKVQEPLRLRKQLFAVRELSFLFWSLDGHT